jgi:hypothetical protein
LVLFIYTSQQNVPSPKHFQRHGMTATPCGVGDIALSMQECHMPFAVQTLYVLWGGQLQICVYGRVATFV